MVSRILCPFSRLFFRMQQPVLREPFISVSRKLIARKQLSGLEIRRFIYGLLHAGQQPGGPGLDHTGAQPVPVSLSGTGRRDVPAEQVCRFEVPEGAFGGDQQQKARFQRSRRIFFGTVR